MIYKLPVLGEIELDDLDDSYHGHLDFNGRKISLYLNFYDYKKTNVENLKAVEHIIENLQSIDERNKLFYLEDFKNGGEAKSHVEFYFEEFEEEVEELEKLINVDQPIESQKLDFLNNFELVGIGLSPAGNLKEEFEFGTFDYSIKIDEEFSNQLLVIRINYLAMPLEVDWES